MVATAAVLVAAFAVLLWLGPAWLDQSVLHGLTPSQRATAVDAFRGRIIQVGAGLLAAGALVFTALNFRLSREGHVTERYTKAIEQLGSDRLDVRLGAIYALERIMADSARDHSTIVEVLAAYVREHSALERPPEGLTKAAVTLAPTRRSRPPTDVEAAVTVLGRRPPGRQERARIDLSETNLVGVDLTDANLATASLRGVDFTDANLLGADLSNADLDYALLNDAEMTNANLAEADLTGAKLKDAALPGADLTEAIFNRADLSQALMLGVIAKNTDFTEANLRTAILGERELDKADIVNAFLPPGYFGVKATDAGPDPSLSSPQDS
jgi:uncharacterized protein YjbI with pentapeptide repeats